MRRLWIAFGYTSIWAFVLVACGESGESGSTASEPAKTESAETEPPKREVAPGKGPFTCPHHPLIVVEGPLVAGDPSSICPHCKMDLVPQEETGAFVCLEHLETVDVQSGRCRTCSKLLVRAPTVDIFQCPKHPEVRLDEREPCPVCDGDLKTAKLAELWVCPVEYFASHGEDAPASILLEGSALGFASEELEFRPGKCSKCEHGRIRVRLVLPHGDHNPRYGGMFRMAPDNWHHIELVVAEPGLAQLYFYDNYTRELDPSKFTARIFRSRMHPEEGLIDGTDSLAFTERPNEPFLTASLDRITFPFYGFLEVDLDGEATRFDFAFQGWSDADATDADAEESPAVETKTPEAITPGTAAEMLAEILKSDVEVQLRIHRAEFDKIYAPAFRAKDIGLLLEEALNTETDSNDKSRLRRIALAAAEVVRGAWALDLHGDQGERARVLESYERFSRGVEIFRELLPLVPR